MAPRKVEAEKSEGAASTPKAHKVSKAKALKATSAHGTYQAMITDAIAALKDRAGTSRPKLKQYVKANNQITATDAAFTSLFNRAIAQGVQKGVFVLPKGSSGGVKLAKKVPAEKKEKEKAPKAISAPAAAPTPSAKPKEKAPPKEKKAAPKAAAAAKPKKATAAATKDASTKVKTGRVTKPAATAATKKTAAPKKAVAPKKERAAPKKKGTPKKAEASASSS